MVGKNRTNLNFIDNKYKIIEEDYNKCKAMLIDDEIKLKPFEFYWKEFIKRMVSDGLKTNDLKMFFRFSSIFPDLSIKDIIPKSITKQLIIKKIPSEIPLGNKNIKVIYRNDIPLIKLSFEQFEIMNKDDMILYSGVNLCLQIQNKKFNRWEDALAFYNKWKKNDVFKKKWKDNKKEIKVMEDVIDIPFPHSFEGGYGKNKEKFIFYAVPEVIDNKGHLIHFDNEPEALIYFEKVKEKWERYLRNYKKNKIEDIFKGKGWKVKT